MTTDIGQDAAAAVPPAGANAALGAGVPPPAPGAAPSFDVPADPAAAKAQIDGLMRDRGFAARYSSSDPQISSHPRALMQKLNRAAYPEDAPAAPAPGSADEAKAMLADRRADPEFIKRYQEGGVAERAEMNRLHQAAYEQGEGGQVAPLPFAFSEDTPEAAQAELRQVADASIEAVGADRAEVSAMVDVIERDHVARRGDDGIPRVMDDTEKLQLDRFLERAWGAAGTESHQAAIDRVKAALKRAGKGGEVLQRSLRHSGPGVAANVFLALAAMGKQS